MLHFVPQFEPERTPQPYAEALARLAGIRHVLGLIDSGGGPADDLDVSDEEVGRAWEEADEAKKRSFDAQTGRIIAATAEGLQALLAERETGREPNAAATQRLADDIREGLSNVRSLMLGRGPAQPVFAMPDAFPAAL